MHFSDVIDEKILLFFEKKTGALPIYEALMEELEKIAREQDAACLRLGAQLYAVPFYERCGYRGTGERFMDEFCEHEMMEKIL